MRHQLRNCECPLHNVAFPMSPEQITWIMRSSTTHWDNMVYGCNLPTQSASAQITYRGLPEEPLQRTSTRRFGFGSLVHMIRRCNPWVRNTNPLSFRGVDRITRLTMRSKLFAAFRDLKELCRLLWCITSTACLEFDRWYRGIISRHGDLQRPCAGPGRCSVAPGLSHAYILPDWRV